MDYKEVLDAKSFARFTRFREIRAAIARSQAIPAYAVFTDAELAGIAGVETLTMEAMAAVPGIGKKKLEKYASFFLTNDPNETGK